MKTCTKCLVDKPLDSFHLAGGENRSSSCKECKSRYWKEKRQSDSAWARQRDALGNAKKLGSSLDQRHKMYDDQQGCCAICGREGARFGEGTRATTLALDHNHRTGQLRKLLCISCNRGLGLFGDDPAVLQRAAEYLKGELDG